MRTILTFILIIQWNLSFSQSFNTEKHDTSNIYYFALKDYCNGLEDTIIYVEKVYPVDEGFPTKIENKLIEYVSQTEIRHLLKKSISGLTIVRIFPIRIIRDEFFINIIPFAVSYESNNFKYINSGGISVYFKYDCEAGVIKYLYTEIDW